MLHHTVCVAAHGPQKKTFYHFYVGSAVTLIIVILCKKSNDYYFIDVIQRLVQENAEYCTMMYCCIQRCTAVYSEVLLCEDSAVLLDTVMYCYMG